MERDYDSGIRDNVQFFTGIEVEHTPAYGLKTLFVTGVHPIDEIMRHYRDNNCQHIYLGANQSFNPGSWENGDLTESDAWDRMIKDTLLTGGMVTLDFDSKHCEWILEGGYCETDTFIPQISVKLPYISLFNYNATLKIDDKGFKATNPGVWCHGLHELQDRQVFTPWTRYIKDTPL
jgi:hypothetical protein